MNTVQAGTLSKEEALGLVFPFLPGDSLDSDWYFHSVAPGTGGVIATFLFTRDQSRLAVSVSPHNANATGVARSRRFEVTYQGKRLAGDDAAFVQRVAQWIVLNDRDTTPTVEESLLVAPERDTHLTPEGDSVDFSISNVCNNNCVFCTNRPTDVQALGLDEIKRRLEALRGSGRQQVEFSAMEPTLRPDLPQILQHAAMLGFSPVHIITNGHRLADPALVDTLVQSGMSKVTISFHAHTPELEKAITRNPKSHANKVAAIGHLKAAYRRLHHIDDPRQEPVFITSVINRLNVAHLHQMLAFFHSLGVHRIAYYFPRHTGSALSRFDEVVPDYTEVRDPLLQCLAYAEEHGLLFRVQDLPPCVLFDTVEEVHKRGNWLGVRLKKEVTVLRPREEAAQAFYSDVADEKSKGHKCATCAVAGSCEGVFTPYIHRRGWGAFTPIPHPT